MRISFDMDGVLADMDAALARIAGQEFRVAVKRVPREGLSGGLPPPGYEGTKSGEANTAGGGKSADDKRGETGDESGHRQKNRDDKKQGDDRNSTGDRNGDDNGGQPAGYEAGALSALSTRQQARLWQRVRETRNFWETLDECEPGTVRRIQKLAHDLRWDVLFVTQRPSSAGRTPQLQTQRWLRRHGFEFPAVYTTQGSRGRIAAALTLDAHIDDRLQNCVDVASESQAWPILVWRDSASFNRIRTGAKNLGIATVRTVGEALDRIAQADRSASQQDQPTLLDRLRRAFKPA